MSARKIKLLILAGFILLFVGAVATAQINARLGEVNQKISTLSGDSWKHYDELNALRTERDTLAGRIPWAIAGIIIGAILMAAGPLREVAQRWRAGQLSIEMKQATVALTIGIFITLLCVLAALTISARIAQLDKDMAELQEKMSSTPSASNDDDEIALLNLQAEKTELSGRAPALTGGAIIGIIVVIAGAYLAWSRRSEWMGIKQ
jgi:ABC-type Fe3+-siderophore transport system permease subunit